MVDKPFPQYPMKKASWLTPLGIFAFIKTKKTP
jgi:hypothetical protein